MQTGFVDLPEKTVYYNENGVMQYGEQKIGNYYYYFDTVFGSMYSGWKTVNGKTRYYQSNGQGKTGEYCENGKWYYFDKNKISYEVIGYMKPDIFDLLLEYIEESDFELSDIIDNLK